MTRRRRRRNSHPLSRRSSSMSGPESQEEVNQISPGTDQTSPARSVSFSTPGGTPAGTQSPPTRPKSANL